MKAPLADALLHPSGVATWPVPASAAVAALPLPEEGAPAVAAGGEAATRATVREAGDGNAASSPAATGNQANAPDAAAAIATDGGTATSRNTAAAPPLVSSRHAGPDTTATTSTPQTFAATSPADAGALGGTFVALVLVVGLILLLGWLARRMPGVAGSGNPALRIVGSLALGPRERVVVVEVGGTQLLLSTGAGGTRALHTLEQPLPVAAPAASPFAQLLAQQFRQSVGLKSKDPRQA